MVANINKAIMPVMIITAMGMNLSQKGGYRLSFFFFLSFDIQFSLPDSPV
jgi:hypothetical protein